VFLVFTMYVYVYTFIEMNSENIFSHTQTPGEEHNKAQEKRKKCLARPA
jgi:hypothetical protein